MRLDPRAKRNAPERRVACRVLAGRLTGQPDPWLLVDNFECDASEFRAEMRAVAESLSSERSGDMLAFRVRPNVEKTGSFYWYLSPQRGPMPVPKADPDVFFSKAKPGMDWLSTWMSLDHPVNLFVGLASLNRRTATESLRQAFGEAVASVARHPAIVQDPARNRAPLAALAARQSLYTLAPPGTNRRSAARVVEELGKVMLEVQYCSDDDPLDTWRERFARSIVTAILKAYVMLDTNRVDQDVDWRDPRAQAALARAQMALSNWVRDLVSLDVLAAALAAQRR